MKNSLIVLTCSIVIVSACSAVNMGLYTKSWNKYKDRQVFDFSLPNEQGEIVRLSDFKGKLIYMDFWSITCGPCYGEFPYADSLHARFHDYKDIVFINIALDKDIQGWKETLAKRKIGGINLIDTTNTIAKEYNLHGYPTYVLIGKQQEYLGYDISMPSEKFIIDYILFYASKGVDAKHAAKKFSKSTSTRLSEEDTEWIMRHFHLTPKNELADTTKKPGK